MLLNSYKGGISRLGKQDIFSRLNCRWKYRQIVEFQLKDCVDLTRELVLNCDNIT